MKESGYAENIKGGGGPSRSSKLGQGLSSFSPPPPPRGNTSFWYISAQRVRFGAGFDRGVVLVHTKGQVGSFWCMSGGRFLGTYFLGEELFKCLVHVPVKQILLCACM